MAMKVTEFDDFGATGFSVSIHLDTTKLDSDGVTPDPDFVRTWTWVSFESSANEGETKAQYRQRIKGETGLMAQLEADRIKPTRTRVQSMLGDI